VRWLETIAPIAVSAEDVVYVSPVAARLPCLAMSTSTRISRRPSAKRVDQLIGQSLSAGSTLSRCATRLMQFRKSLATGLLTCSRSLRSGTPTTTLTFACDSPCRQDTRSPMSLARPAALAAASLSSTDNT